MKRYLGFAGEYEVQIRDFVGDYEELARAKEAVMRRDEDGMPLHIKGFVLDTTTGRLLEWDCDGRSFGSDRWRKSGFLQPLSA